MPLLPAFVPSDEVKMIIYVGNLPLDTTAAQLNQEFTAFGQVVSVNIMNDKHIGSGQPRGYAYITMASKTDGCAAISGMTGKILGGHIINVVEALPLSDKKGAGLPHGREVNRFSRKYIERGRQSG
jgi:RNA recognition motif-containing protein